MQIHELRGADGVLYYTTTSVAARLGVSYADAKALIESGRIPSVTAESVGVTLNKPGARIVSEVALEAYRRGDVGVTMMETPSTVFEPGRVSAPPAGFGSVPAPPAKKRSGLKIAGLGCLALIGLFVVVIVIAAIAGDSGSDDAPTRSRASAPVAREQTREVERWVCKSMLLEYQNVERGLRDEYNAMRRWGEWMRRGESDPAIVFRYYSNRERSLFWELMDAPDVTSATFAGDALIQHCLSAEVTAVATATATAIWDATTPIPRATVDAIFDDLQDAVENEGE